MDKLKALGSAPIGRGLVGGAVIGGAVPYVVMRPGENEEEDVFNARRRGIAAASAVAGGVLGSRILPHLTVDRFIEKRGSAAAVAKDARREAGGFLDSYFRSQRLEGEKAEREEMQAQLKGMTAAQIRAQEKEFAERREETERRKRQGFQPRPLISRAAETAAGGALIAKNVPQIPFARGRALLFHGTGVGGVRGILREGDEGGLSVRYAGTKGRLNAVLVPNALTKTLLENGAGKHLGDADVARIQNDIVNRLRQARGTPVIEAINAALNSLAETKPELGGIIEKTRKQMPTALSNAGVRIYFANSPHNVMTWSDDSNELQKIMNQVATKAKDAATNPKSGGFAQDSLGRLGRDALDFVTGGATDVGRQYLNAADYQKALQFAPDKITPAQAQELAAKAPTGSAFAFGVNVPTRDVKMLADFKGIAPFLRVSPRLQGLLGKMPGFEGYDPNNDISTARNVGRENIKFIDIQHPGQAPTRHFLTSYSPEKLSIADRLRGVRSAALPLALTGLGANMIYRGVAGRPGAIQDTITAAKRRFMDNQPTDATKQPPEETKTAAPATYGKFKPMRNMAGLVGKYGLPTLAVGTGIAATDQFIGDKIMPIKDYEIEPLTAQEEARGATRDIYRGLQGGMLRAGVGMGIAALGAKAGSSIARKKLQQMFPDLEAALKANPNDKGLLALKNMLDKGGGRIGGLAGLQLPGIAAVGGAMTSRALNAARRGDDPLREQLGETRQEIAASPWKSTIVPALTTLGVGTYAGGQVAKNFPGMLSSLRRKVMFEGVDPIGALTGQQGGPKIYPGQLVPESYSRLLEDLANDPSAAYTLNELRAIQDARQGASTTAAKGMMGALGTLSEIDLKALVGVAATKDEKKVEELARKAVTGGREAYETADKLFQGHDERQRAAAEKIMQQSGLERALVGEHLSAALGGEVFVPRAHGGLYTGESRSGTYTYPRGNSPGHLELSSGDEGHAVYDLYEQLQGTGHFTVQDLQKRFRLAGEARQESRKLNDYRYLQQSDKVSDPVADAMMHIGRGEYDTGGQRLISAPAPGKNPLRGEGAMEKLRFAALPDDHPDVRAALTRRAEEIAAERRARLEAELADAQRVRAEHRREHGDERFFYDNSDRLRAELDRVDEEAKREARKERRAIAEQLPWEYRYSVFQQEANKERANKRRPGSTAV
jgi:hypothetical protein